jgi:alanyl-tRNA synthetase
MSPTERLYYSDPFLFTFSGRVVAHGAWNGAASVILDRTAFYPESGGQMADRGELGGARVTDVQVDDAGVVHHLVSGSAPPAIGCELQGTIDRHRRRVHMALHTGQHMLSRALADIASAATVSSRLGESTCTIDLDRDALDERRVEEAERLVNSVIDDDVIIQAFFPSPDELAALPLRRAPKVTENIRVVSIGDFDVSPCGGTHCTRSAQVGLVRVLGIERYKGKARVSFSAGRRAREDLYGEAEVLRDLGRSFTCGPRDVSGAVDKIRRELSEARDALGRARGRLSEALAAELTERALAREDRLAIAFVDDASVELLRSIAKRITAHPELVSFLAGRVDGGIAAMVSRGSAATFDCGAFLKRAAAAAGGRGGGRPEHAEGRLPEGTDFPALVARALQDCRP